MKYLILSAAVVLYGYVSINYGRIGIRWNPGSHKIIKVFPGSPASEAGLLKGDKILYINGEVPKLGRMDGISGTCVQLTVVRNLPDRTKVFTVVIPRISAYKDRSSGGDF